MLEIIGAVLIAFGFLAFYFMLKNDVAENKALVILLIGLFSILGGSWFLLKEVTRDIIYIKIRGLITLLIGFFLAVKYPDIESYQPKGFTHVGVFIGLVFMILGTYWLILV